MQKKAQMGQIEEDQHGLQLRFLKSVRLNSFQSSSLLFVDLNITLRIHICLSRSCDFVFYK